MPRLLALLLVLLLALPQAVFPQAARALDDEQLEALFSEDGAQTVHVFEVQELQQRIQEAVDRNDPVIQYTLGHMFQHGQNVQPDLEQSIKWYELAAANDYIPAMLALGRLYKSGAQGLVVGAAGKALPWFRRAAEAGRAEGWYELGLIYEKGLGVFRNDKKAFSYYQKAADGGDLSGHMKLAIFYQNGIGVEKDMRLAVRHYNHIKDASKNQNVQAHVNLLLGTVYADIAEGEGDPKKRLQWYRFAAEHGEVRGIVTLADAYRDGVAGVEQDYIKAVDWYRKAAERDNVYAMQNLGYIYSNGLGVSRDYKAALDWYQRAAELRSAEAAWNVGNFYHFGYGVQKDGNEARKWYRRMEVLQGK